jgi:hypothetical protein
VSRRPARITQAEINRAIRAVLKAGATCYDVVIEEARVIIRVGGVDKPKSETVGSWDDAVAELERQ